MMTNVIEIQNVSKRFGNLIALERVTFSVPDGSVFALLGENGAGKSTLIRSLLGYHRPDEGTIRVLEFDPIRNPLEVRRKVGYVSDMPVLYEWMTVDQIRWFASGFYPRGYSERFIELAKKFELPWQSKIRVLSKGMRSKLALALALAFDPDLLILDEPTSGLDPVVRRQFLESMVDRAATGKTVFLSSHQVQEVERIADWVAFLHQGRLQAIAPLEDLKSSLSLITFSQRDTLLPYPSVLDESRVLQETLIGRSRRLMVTQWSDADRDQFSRDANIFDLSVCRPNLEELYIAFTSNDERRNVAKGAFMPQLHVA